MRDIFVVLQNTTDGGRVTLYPEVHYVYSDDTFIPAMDAVEQLPGDISLLVDFDETGTEVLSCRSLSPSWQVLDVSYQPQALARDQPGHLLCVTGTKARVPTDIPDLDGSFASQVARATQLVESLEQRNRELRKVLGD